MEKTFKTPEYCGVWLAFAGDRMAFRASVERYLQSELKDPAGKLVVEENGPHWKSDLRLELSYSHTQKTGVLVYSLTHALGVDIESESREFNGEPLKLAERFFPAEETETIAALPEIEQRISFLKLWVEKEAYAKLTRLGLAKTLALGIIPSEKRVGGNLPVSPVGFFSHVFFQPL